MKKDYRVRFVDRYDGLEYTEAGQTYRFPIAHVAKTWRVDLPPTKAAQVHVLDDAERSRILPRIEDYLVNVKCFFIFGLRHPVEFREA